MTRESFDIPIQRIPWWVRVALWFVRPRIGVDGDAYVVAKTWRGVTYILSDGRL